jgi:hypothetical protein
MRIAIWCGFAFTFIFYLIAFILAFVSATPRRGETWLEHEEYDPIMNIEITGAIWLPTIGIFIDLYILILPLYCLSTLHMPLKRKLAAASVFLTGIMYAKLSTTSY